MPSAPRSVRRSHGVTRLGDAIADRRRELGLTRRELAERAALSYPFVSELERGRKSPSTASLSSLARALELTVAELIDAAESPQGARGRGDDPEPDRARGPAEDVLPELRDRAGAAAALDELSRFVREVVRDEIAESGPERRIRPAIASVRRAHAPSEAALTAEVLDAVRTILDDETVVVDDQGDVPITRDGVMVYVRVVADPSSVLVFSPVLVDVAPSPALLARLNELNEGVRFVRFCSTEGGVVVDLELFAHAFDPVVLQLAIRAVSGASVRFGPELQQELGGRLFLDDEPLDDARRRTAGYL